MSTPVADDAAPDQRLHPWSWLFVLLMQLRQFLLPLVALLVFGGRGDSDSEEMWSNLAALVVIVVLVASSILQYLTYHYRIGRDAISVRTGVISLPSSSKVAARQTSRLLRSSPIISP